MLNRFSVVWLVSGAIAGYAMAGPSARAQTESLPFSVGETVRLQYLTGTYATGDSFECRVAEIRGIFVRCESDRFGTQRQEDWRSLKRVARITKEPK
jgi:hypothetical protein